MDNACLLAEIKIVIMDKYKISIGEPWDFEGPDGPNLIKGSIIKTLSQTTAIFKSDHILSFKGYTGVFFVLTTRYMEDSLIPPVTVNGGLLLNNEYGNQTEDELIKNSIFVFIGGISWCKNSN